MICPRARDKADQAARAVPSHGGRLAPNRASFEPYEKRLYVALSNADAVAVVDTATGSMIATLSTLLPDQKFRGSFPSALALARTAKHSLLRIQALMPWRCLTSSNLPAVVHARGFVPTEGIPPPWQ